MGSRKTGTSRLGSAHVTSVHRVSPVSFISRKLSVAEFTAEQTWYLLHRHDKHTGIINSDWATFRVQPADKESTHLAFWSTFPGQVCWKRVCWLYCKRSLPDGSTCFTIFYIIGSKQTWIKLHKTFHQIYLPGSYHCAFRNPKGTQRFYP